MTNSSYTPPAEMTARSENIAMQNVAVHAKRDSGMCLSRVLGDITNCSISHITVNVNPVICLKDIEEEFDAITKDIQCRALRQ